MTSPLGSLSASVTRILSLTGFSPVLKTKDVQQAFSEWENANGGFKIKWLDDTSLYIVFQDASVAKRAYLSTLASPPAIFTSPTSDTIAQIRPYDGPDAQTVIQAVNARVHTNPAARGHASRASIAVGGGVNGAHARFGSVSGRNGYGSYGGYPMDGSQTVNIPPGTSSGREPSPTLPSLPSQPTLDALISSSLSPDLSPEAETASAPRIGDPGKRMVAHSLGVRHPSLGQRRHSGDDIRGSGGPGGADHALREVQRAMGGLSVAE